MAVAQTALDPWAVQLRVGARDARYALGAVLGPAPGGSGAVNWSDGVLPSASVGGQIIDLLPVADNPTWTMAVLINLGQCVITRPGQGPYICSLDTTGRIVLDAADPTNPRIDAIIARVSDDRIGDATTGFTLEAVKGTPSATPQAPALPAGALRLADVTVAAGTKQITPTAIVDRRRSASVRTGIGVLLPGDNPTSPGAYPGQVRYRLGSWKPSTAACGAPPPPPGPNCSRSPRVPG